MPEQDSQNLTPRGIALQRAIDYAAVSGEQIHDAIVDNVLTDPFASAVADHIVEATDATLDEVAEAMGFLGDEDSAARVISESELQTAELQYDDALAASGLRFEMGLDGVELSVTDAPAFRAAVQDAQIPLDPEAYQRLQDQLRSIVDGALIQASGTIIRQDVPAAIATCGGQAPHTPTFIAAETRPELPSEASRDLAAGIVREADAIATGLDDLRLDPVLSTAMHQLAIAAREGRVMEWAVAYNLSILGHGDEPIGIDRIVTQQEWDIVYLFLDHLRQVAPNSAFAREVRATLLRDIKTAQQQTPETDVPVPQEKKRAEFLAIRDDWREQARPLLGPAAERIQAILPGTVAEILLDVRNGEQVLQEAGVAFTGVQEVLRNAYSALAHTLDGTSSEHAIRSLEQFEIALGHLAAFLEANGAAVEHFRNYKL